MNLARRHLRVTSIVVASLALLGGKFQGREEYRCTYAHKVECGDNGKCEPAPIGGAYLLIPHLDSLVAATSRPGRRLPQIRRCDARGCTPIEVSAAYSGMFVNVSRVGGGYYLKIVRDSLDQVKRGEFIESATSFLASVNYWGQCRIP